MHEYGNNYYIGFRRRKKKSRLLTLIVFVLVIFISYKSFGFVFSIFDSNLDENKKPEIVKSVKTEPTQIPSQELSKIIQSRVSSLEGDYSVYIKNLKSNEEYKYFENRSFDTASLYKLWVMGEAHRQIESGSLSLNQVLKKDIEELNRIFNIDEEYAERKEGTIEQTVDLSINRMITISDNYSALLLAQELGNSKIANFLDENGFHDSRMGGQESYPRSNVADIALFYEKLYKGEIVSKVRSGQMLEILKKQNLNNGLPRLLPEEVVIAHKTGELGQFKHDAGIVYSETGDYIIVVMTKTAKPLDAQTQIANISKDVFDYFRNKK